MIFQCVSARELKEEVNILKVCVCVKEDSLVYYNSGLIFIVFAISLIGNDKTVVAKVIAEIWEHGDRATVKSDKSFTICLLFQRSRLQYLAA